MNRPSVCYIVAVYNGARYLAETLRSITGQTRAVDEVIVVDDGSTDESATIAEQFGAPVRCVRQPNAGQSAARNHGVRLSRGDMLAFLDADDLIHPGKIQQQLERFAAEPELMLIDAFSQNFWSPEIPPQQRNLDGWQALTHREKPFPEFIGSWLFRRVVWERLGEFDENRRFGEDSEWHDRVRFSGMPMATLHAVLARRRLHHANLTRSNFDHHIDGLHQLYKERFDRARARRSGRSAS